VKIALAAVGGLVVGSFLNVVAYRLPRRESLISPGSRCPSCGVPIKPYDNIPVIGWLLLRGRCRACGESIAWRYPAVELLTAALFVAVVLVKHSTHSAVMGLALVSVLIPISLIDLERRIIPNKITAPASVVALVLGLVLHPASVPAQLAGGAAGGGGFLLLVLAYPRGMGMGDAKLAGMLGLYLSLWVGLAIAVAVLTASLFGFAVMARVGIAQGRKTAVPFGPFLALGGVVALLAGHGIVHAWLNAF
jgi:leader peptidase (prepilin peptidase) / N-methyltransferase